MTFEDLYKQQVLEDQRSLSKLQMTPYGREAISKAYHVPVDYLEKQSKMGYVDIMDDINKNFYEDENTDPNKDPRLVGNLSDMFNRL